MIVQLGAPHEPKETVFPTLGLNVGLNNGPHAIENETQLKTTLPAAPQKAGSGDKTSSTEAQKAGSGAEPKEMKLPTFEQALELPSNLTKLASNMAEEKTRSCFHEFIEFVKKSSHPLECPDDVAKACFYGPQYAHLAPNKGKNTTNQLDQALSGRGGDANLLNHLLQGRCGALRGDFDDSDGSPSVFVPSLLEGTAQDDSDGQPQQQTTSSPKAFSPSSRVTTEDAEESPKSTTGNEGAQPKSNSNKKRKKK